VKVRGDEPIVASHKLGESSDRSGQMFEQVERGVLVVHDPGRLLSDLARRKGQDNFVR
jgi:hypothetical protein